MKERNQTWQNANTKEKQEEKLQIKNCLRQNAWISLGLVFLAEVDEIINLFPHQITETLQKSVDKIPQFVNSYGADLGLPFATYCMLRVADKSKLIALSVPFGISTGVEIVQLITQKIEPSILEVTKARFDPLDIGVYAIGVLGALGVEKYLENKYKTKK